LTAEAVQWLEEEFDSRRIQGMAGYEYEPPANGSTGCQRPVLECIDDVDDCCFMCRTGTPERCSWFRALFPAAGASTMLLELPWTVEHERAWLEWETLSDREYDNRIDFYREKTGKEHT
jgi:hypothetical protein